MKDWISRFLAVAALTGCSYAIYWQIAHLHAARFSFLFASAVFAAVCCHWLLEELDLVRHDAPGGAGGEV
jgi:hypothetical protein